MVDFLFYLFALITILGSGSIVLSRNPVNAAMLLILSFVGTASLFIILGAYFLAAVQLAVYAGAVVVLFLFIIMLLNVDAVQHFKQNYIALAAGAVTGLLLIAGILKLVKRGDNFTLATLGEVENLGATTKSFGVELFTTYMLPFQLAGVLLLIAMLGVIFISTRNPGKEKESA